MKLAWRKPPEVHDIECRRCGDWMRVVKDSAPDRERVCNLCIYREADESRGAS